MLSTSTIVERIVSNAIKKAIIRDTKEELRKNKILAKEETKRIKKELSKQAQIFKKAMNTSLPDNDDIFDDEMIFNNNCFTSLSQKFIDDNKLDSSKKPVSNVTLDDIRRSAYHSDKFSHIGKFDVVATIKLDDSLSRQTLIKFDYTDKNKWYDCGNWIYLFVVDDMIVKIGGTKNGLKQRAASYLCGHHTRKSNACSITNGIIYNTFLSYLQQGAVIKMFGMRCPPVYATVDVFGETHTVETQTFDIYESVLIRQFANEYGTPPVLSSRSDPRYS
ncbi:hypothetical protein PBCVKS1B_266R [Paramecium bursaria Chlorella virus KS1B]|nr:hypothetical protein PBCVKS1B_266R [Paramecium bursaria Chlorella virus KS1B]